MTLDGNHNGPYCRINFVAVPHDAGPGEQTVTVTATFKFADAWFTFISEAQGVNTIADSESLGPLYFKLHG